MDRTITAAGSTDNDTTVILSMDSNILQINTDSDLTAKELFDFFDYKRDTAYTVSREGNGKVRTEVFESFCKLVEDIAKKLSDIRVDEGSSDAEVDNLSGGETLFSEDLSSK